MALYESIEGRTMTIKELAEELSVSKPAINNKLVELDLKDRLIKQGNKYVIPGEVADQVRQAFTKQKPKPAGTESTPGDDLMYQEQIALLKEQIALLTDHIRTLNNQLEVKDLQIERAQATSQYLLAGNTQKDIHEVEDVTVAETETMTDKTDTIKRRGIFSKLFR